MLNIPFDEIGNVKRVGIQLPDGLKRRAAEIARSLEERGYEVVISGETCFGACDVDLSLLEVVDMLLHFGHTQIIKHNKIIYVPYFVEYDPRIELEIPEKRIALIATAQYVNKLAEVAAWLEEKGYEVEIGKPGGRVSYPGQVLGCNYTVLKGSGADAVVFVGDGLFHAVGAAIYTGKKVYAYNPLSKETRIVEKSDFERKRFFQISRCVGKRSAGIIVSSKPGQRRLELARKLKRFGEENGFECQIIYLNNLRGEELINLPFEFFVNTACPRLSYDDAFRFEKPLITPQEFEFLLGLRDSIAVDEIEI